MRLWQSLACASFVVLAYARSSYELFSFWMIVVAAGRVPQARRLRQAPPAVATAIGVAIPAPTAAAIVVIVVVISEVVVSLATMIQVTATTTAATT